MPFKKGDRVEVSLGGCRQVGTVRAVRADGKLVIGLVFRTAAGKQRRKVVRMPSLVVPAPEAP